MKKTIMYLTIVMFFSFTDISYSTDECSTFFIQHPFLPVHSSTYEVEEFLTLTDSTPITISSSVIGSETHKWTVLLHTQKDTAELLKNLLTKSDLTIDDSFFILSNLIIPKLDSLKNIDIKKEKSNFNELMLDVLGMKDISILLNNIRKYNRSLMKLLQEWTPQGFNRTYKELLEMFSTLKTSTQLNSLNMIKKLTNQNISPELEEINPQFYKFYKEQEEYFNEKEKYFSEKNKYFDDKIKELNQ